MDVSYIDEFSSDEIAERQYSTLDLCDLDRFTLIGDLEVPGVKTCRVGRDFEVVGQGADAWLKGAGLENGGGLLIRPDQHILLAFGPGTTVQSLQLALKTHLAI